PRRRILPREDNRLVVGDAERHRHRITHTPSAAPPQSRTQDRAPSPARCPTQTLKAWRRTIRDDTTHNPTHDRCIKNITLTIILNGIQKVL
ncbi:MAG: hypothetical protein PUI30_09965, partial [Bacteroidales bacterium]|nr:hypothetical protein [Bacteroidales bacterium]